MHKNDPTFILNYSFAWCLLIPELGYQTFILLRHPSMNRAFSLESHYHAYMTHSFIKHDGTYSLVRDVPAQKHNVEIDRETRRVGGPSFLFSFLYVYKKQWDQRCYDVAINLDEGLCFLRLHSFLRKKKKHKRWHLTRYKMFKMQVSDKKL